LIIPDVTITFNDSFFFLKFFIPPPNTHFSNPHNSTQSSAKILFHSH